jgi:predicted nuclease with RNAse H fold
MGVDVGVRALDVARLDAQDDVEHRRIAPEALGGLLDQWQPDVVAVDAPSGWAASGSARASEVALIAAGVRCFRTPTPDRAGSSFYDWVRVGHAVFGTCESRGYELGRTVPIAPRAVIEVFPHATTLALLGAPYVTRFTRDKRAARRGALERVAIAIDERASLDAIDAALCAYAARAAAAGKVDVYGEAIEGPVFVPSARLSRSSAAR